MKRLVTLLAAAGMAWGVCRAQISPEAYGRWHGDKFSMFVHFGLYSVPGGVWDGEPVREGYSEQIQSFAGIFSDRYARIASEFDPAEFDAGGIAALAKQAGMRSVVFTAKHHDGFCMFRSATTDFDSWDATPVPRDFVREMAEACRREGLRLGLYFSNIDWHYPGAYPISSHNADFIPDDHFELNKAQIRELLTSYGPVSELWFDMGSYTPAQSREMYALVHSLQPDCMVSGRLGNDAYDFAVMADNKHPEGALQTAWQTPASMFDETWSYRSWQERGRAEDKALEKLTSLLSAVSHGGNYLLNIGPAGDGSVVEFEREVLLLMGRWLDRYGEAVYGTEASPFRDGEGWYFSTRKGRTLYLIVPDAGAQAAVRFPAGDNAPVSARSLVDGTELAIVRKGGSYEVERPAAGDGYAVAAVEFEREVSPEGPPPMAAGRGTVLSQENAAASYSYSCFDYYSNYRSTVGYSWSVDVKRAVRGVDIIYTDDRIGREISVAVDGGDGVTLRLGEGERVDLGPTEGLRVVRSEMHGPSFGIFDGGIAAWAGREGEPAEAVEGTVRCGILENRFLVQTIESDRDRTAVFEVRSGNGVEIAVNGRTVCKHLNRYRCRRRDERVALPLKKGANEVVARFYNRFENSMPWRFAIAEDQTVRRLSAGIGVPAGRHTLSLRDASPASPHADMEMHDTALVLR